jgi:uncharacterized membrane protein HdeD (DUF308 family)
MGEHVIRREELRQPYALAGPSTRWWAFLILGIATVLVGVVLLVSPEVAVNTLALLIALGLIFAGAGELVSAGRYRGGWEAAAGAILLVAGVVTLAWPGITLWTLGVVTGVGLLLSGSVRLLLAFADRPDGWGWLAVSGALAVVVGLLAIAWPGATVLVLALVLGVGLVIYGATEIAYALALRDLQQGRMAR